LGWCGWGWGLGCDKQRLYLWKIDIHDIICDISQLQLNFGVLGL
jgi:hypothetical protein